MKCAVCFCVVTRASCGSKSCRLVALRHNVGLVRCPGGCDDTWITSAQRLCDACILSQE